MEKISSVVLSLGSNIENRIEHLREAVAEISNRVGTVIQISPVYESEAVGFQSNTDFLNLCLVVQTQQSPRSVLKLTQEIEKLIGRKTKSTNGYQSREIDIDLIFFDDAIIQASDLVIPHPSHHLRKFVLLPLRDIVPNYVDPVTGETITTKINQCTDSSKISMTHHLI